MGRFAIGFNHQGRYTTLPQLFVRVNSEDLAARGQGPTGVLALLAAGAGFLPPKTATLLPFDVGAPSRYFPPCDLRTAAEFAVRGFSDLNGSGPGSILVVPVSPATKSTINLATGATVRANLNSKGWGTRMNQILVRSETGLVTVTLPTDTTPVIEAYPYTTVAGLVADINERSGILEAVSQSEGTPDNFADTAMTGGTEPAPTNTDWSDSFTALAQHKVNCVHVASAASAIWAMLLAYCTAQRARGFIGSDTLRNWNGAANRTTAIAALKAEALLVNSPRLMHVGLGMDGQPGKFAAARYAALAAGLEPSVPMTNKHLDVTSLEALLTEDEVGGAAGLHLGGIAAPIQDVHNRGSYLVSRGLSTWTTDANLYNSEQSVLAGVDAVADLLAQDLQEFIGGEGTVAVLARARRRTIFRLTECTRSTSTVRIESFDPDSVVVGFTSSTVLHVTARIRPILPINWVDLELALEATEITLSVDVNLAGSQG